jgi:hypothetical protein
MTHPGELLKENQLVMCQVQSLQQWLFIN